MANSRAKARKIPDKPETSYWIKKEESAQRKTGDVKRTEKLVIERFPLAIPFNMEEKQSSSLSKNANKCRRNNWIRKSPLEKHHNNDTEDDKTTE